MRDDIQRYNVIVVNVPAKQDYEVQDKRAEIERYFYGSYFYLGSRRGARSFEVFWLVEDHYIDQIVPRLASGLWWAHPAGALERADFGL